jgi:hypothetical protein
MSQRRILELLAASHNGLTVDELAEKLYSNDANGGPEFAFDSIRVMISKLKKKGHQIETRYAGRGNKGVYTLKDDATSLALKMGLKYAKYAYHVEQVGMTMYLATSEQYAMHQDRAAVIAADIAVIERGIAA